MDLPQKNIQPIELHKFKNEALQLEALTHKTFVYENPMLGRRHNERLEFLGDSVIGIIVIDYLYSRFPDYEIGQLSILKSKITCRSALAQFALRLRLGEIIWLGSGSIHLRDSEKILEDVFEAYIGAMFLDVGKDFHNMLDFLKPFIEPMVNKLIDVAEESLEELEKLSLPKELLFHNPVDRLQTWSLKKGFSLPVYQEVGTVEINGKNYFIFRVQINDTVITAEGTGQNKKEAKKQAAISCLEFIATLGSENKLAN